MSSAIRLRGPRPLIERVDRDRQLAPGRLEAFAREELPEAGFSYSNGVICRSGMTALVSPPAQSSPTAVSAAPRSGP